VERDKTYICSITAILEFYFRFRFWPTDRHWRVILHRGETFYPNCHHLAPRVTVVCQYIYPSLPNLMQLSVLLTEIWPKIQIHGGDRRHPEIPKSTILVILPPPQQLAIWPLSIHKPSLTHTSSLTTDIIMAEKRRWQHR